MAEDWIGIEGRRYMWNGEQHDTESEAESQVTRYGSEGFDTRLVEENGKFFVYTRRVAKDVPIEGAPP